MRDAGVVRRSVATAMCATALLASSAQALVIDMTVDFGSLIGAPGVLAFDFQATGLTGNTVVLGPLSPPGDSTAGDVANAPPDLGPWTFHDTGFEELLVTYLALPSAVSFSFQTSEHAPPDDTIQPDVFSFSILDPETLLPLITTANPNDPNDLTCSGVLFFFNLGVSGAPTVCSADQDVGVSNLSVAPNPSVPEPATLALVLAGLAAASMRKKPGRARQSPPDQS